MTHKEKYNDTATVDVIIPAYRPGREFGELLHRLEEQEYRPRRILVMNTGEQYWNREWEKCPILEVHHLEQKDFDHGGTRRRAAELSNADIMIFMTQDALPADRKVIGNLVCAVSENPGAGAALLQRYRKMRRSVLPMPDSFQKVIVVSWKNIPVLLIIRSSPR